MAPIPPCWQMLCIQGIGFGVCSLQCMPSCVSWAMCHHVLHCTRWADLGPLILATTPSHTKAGLSFSFSFSNFFAGLVVPILPCWPGLCWAWWLVIVSSDWHYVVWLIDVSWDELVTLGFVPVSHIVVPCWYVLLIFTCFIEPASPIFILFSFWLWTPDMSCTYAL